MHKNNKENNEKYYSTPRRHLNFTASQSNISHGKEEEQKLNRDFFSFCDRFKSHTSRCGGIPLYISPQYLDVEVGTQHIKLATSHLLKCKVLYTTSGNRLIIIFPPLPLLLFALFLYSSKVNPQPSCETQLSDLYSNLFLVTLLVLRGIKCCKLPLDFLFCFFIKQIRFSVRRLCLKRKPRSQSFPPLFPYFVLPKIGSIINLYFGYVVNCILRQILLLVISHQGDEIAGSCRKHMTQKNQYKIWII